MQSVNLDDYSVNIGYGILQENLSNNIFLGRDIVVIYDKNVDYILSYFSKNISALYFELESIEENKSIDKAMEITSFLIENNIGRDALLIAVGGGITGDLVGFVASTYMRGIDFVNIPTTLLSQVDSSIGGKVAVNFNGYKNILGSFHNPKLVIVDTIFLKTLSQRQFNNGLAEVIKYGLIQNKSIIEGLYNNIDITETIYDCLIVKKKYVEEDFYDNGVRKKLNLGHTIGHAIELDNLDIFHGEAVSIGTCIFLKTFQKELYPSVLKIYQDFDLPTNIDNVNIDKLLSDKKIMSGFIDETFLIGIGNSELRKIKVSQLIDMLGE